MTRRLVDRRELAMQCARVGWAPELQGHSLSAMNSRLLVGVLQGRGGCSAKQWGPGREAKHQVLRGVMGSPVRNHWIDEHDYHQLVQHVGLQEKRRGEKPQEVL